MHAWDVLGLDNLIAPNIFYLRSNLLGASNTVFENGQKYLKEFSLCQKLKYFSNLILTQENSFVQLNVSLLHCFCVLFNSFAKLYTHFWPFTSTSGGKIILQTLVVVITATSVCKMILPPLVLVNGQK